MMEFGCASKGIRILSLPVLASVLVIYCSVINAKCSDLREHTFYLMVFVGQEAGNGLSGSLAARFLTRLQQRCQPALRSHLKASPGKDQAMWLIKEHSSLWVVGLRALLSPVSQGQPQSLATGISP